MKRDSHDVQNEFPGLWIPITWSYSILLLQSRCRHTCSKCGILLFMTIVVPVLHKVDAKVVKYENFHVCMHV
jgi:hypothetical protein